MRNYVLYVHGIGKQVESDFTGVERRVRRAFAREVRRRGGDEPPDDALIWQSARWSEVTQYDQDWLCSRLAVKGMAKGLMVDALGDAVAYSRLPEGGGKYAEVQAVVRSAVESLAHQAEQRDAGERVPLTVLAHSLGTVIATGTLMRMELPANLELRYLFTYGSPIALYGLRYGIDAFRVPLRPNRWVNYRFPHDLIAYPLQPLSEEWASAVQDVRLSPLGGEGIAEQLREAVVALLPLVRDFAFHSRYLRNRRVLREIGGALAERWLPPSS